jgi:RNA polymerase sigma factor for flagellar operon FliA
MTSTIPPRERAPLIAEHAELADRVARDVARGVPGWVDPEDLVGAAMDGLAEAAGRFHPACGVPFVAFAAPRVRRAVLDALCRVVMDAA